MAGHSQLVVERAPNNPFAVDDVSHPRSAQPEAAPNVVQPPYLAPLVARKTEWSTRGLAETPELVDSIGADAYDYGVAGNEGAMGLAKASDLGCAAPGESARIEENNDVPTSVVGEREPFAGGEPSGEVRSLGADL